jgi:hypothetical protein
MMVFCRSLSVLFVVFAMVGCGGGGAASGSGAAPTLGKNLLFVPDFGAGVIAAFPVLDAAPGSTLQGNIISPKSFQGKNVQYDGQRDELYTAAGGSGLASINVYVSASNAVAGATPARNFLLPSDLISVNKLVLDVTMDTLYVAASRQYDGAVLVFKNASSRSGAATPDRSIYMGSGVNDFALDLVRNVAYIGNSIVGISRISNFDKVSGVLPVTPNIFSFFTSGVAVDVIQDRLYVADVSNGVHIVKQASTASASLVGTLAIANPQFATFDQKNDRLYISAYKNVFVINSASTLTSASTVPTNAAVAIPNAVSVGGFAFP